MMKIMFSLQIQNDVVDILMAYTQPSLAKEESEEGRLSFYSWRLILCNNTREETQGHVLVCKARALTLTCLKERWADKRTQIRQNSWDLRTDMDVLFAKIWGCGWMQILQKSIILDRS